MRKFYIFIALFAIGLNSCGTATNTTLPDETIVVSPTKPKHLPTATRRPTTPTPIPSTEISTFTTTPGPVIDSLGNITWHPQEVLIASEVGGGDGAGFDYPPEFVLLWDGTLLQAGGNQNGPPYISKLDRPEMCKILNTVDASGFFSEESFYNFPFDGAGSQYITVNAWKSNSSGSQVFSYALSGAPYYDGLFCRDCPIPSEETIIQPGLANVYFLLKDYVSSDRKLAPVDKLNVYFTSVNDQPTNDWPITSISSSELIQMCEDAYCYDTGMIIDGEAAREFENKIKSDQVFVVESFLGSMPFRVSYRAIWPYEPSIMYYSSIDKNQYPAPPPDFQLTCNSSDGQFPLLPLKKENKYWYYAPDGKWSAEVANEVGQFLKIRIINKSGYEKLYQYDPFMFGQASLKVFPRFWTADGEYFFVNLLPGNFDSQKTPFVNSLGLQRISISNGTVSYMFAGVNGQQYAYALSEKGNRVAYIRQGDDALRIIIKDTYSGVEQAATLAIPINGTGFYEAAGTIVWSMDERVLYLAATYNENGITSGHLIAVDTANVAKQKTINENAKPIKLNQWFYNDRYVGICAFEADIEDYCTTKLNRETGEIEVR